MSQLILEYLGSLFSIFSFLYLYFKLTNKEFRFLTILGSNLLIISVKLIKLVKLLWLKHLLFFMGILIILLFLKKKINKSKIFLAIISFLGGFIFYLILFGLIYFGDFLLHINFGLFDFLYLKYASAFGMFIMVKYTCLIKFIKWWHKHINLDAFELVVKYSLFIILINVIVTFLIKYGNKYLILFILNGVLIGVFFKYYLIRREGANYLKILKANNDFYIETRDEERIFKHNLIARLLGIKSVSNKRGRRLIDELILEYNHNLNFRSKLDVIPYGLEGVIFQKLYNYQRIVNIKIYNEINVDIYEILKPRVYNCLVEKVVILLDNAIDACLKSEDKLLIINLSLEKDWLTVEIKNTFSDIISIDELGFKNYSTKGQLHGIGLFSIFHEMGVELHISIINNFFVTKVRAKKRGKHQND